LVWVGLMMLVEDAVFDFDWLVLVIELVIGLFFVEDVGFRDWFDDE